MKNKVCKVCLIEKPLIDFQIEKNGKIPYACKECKKQMYRDWRVLNKEKTKEWKKEYHLKTTEQRKWHIIKTKYGIDENIYNKILLNQDGGCAICKAKESNHNKTNMLIIDHCHKTKKVRGLLCNRCNTSIGKFNDDVVLLQQAINYINAFRK